MSALFYARIVNSINKDNNKITVNLYPQNTFNMKKNLFHFSAVILCSCLFTSCATIVPVTDNIIEQVGGTDQLENFQYYISRSIVLDRTDNQTDAEIVKGKANIIQKIEKDKVTIKGSTPGVLLRYRTLPDGRPLLFVGFEPDDNFFLQFVKYNNDNKRDSPYSLAVSNASDEIVAYGSDLYKYSFPTKRSLRSLGLKKGGNIDLTPPHLLIKLNKKMVKNVNKRVAKGRTLK